MAGPSGRLAAKSTTSRHRDIAHPCSVRALRLPWPRALGRTGPSVCSLAKRSAPQQVSGRAVRTLKTPHVIPRCSSNLAYTLNLDVKRRHCPGAENMDAPREHVGPVRPGWGRILGPRQLGRVISFRLSFLLCAVGILMIPTLWSCCENYVHTCPVRGMQRPDTTRWQPQPRPHGKQPSGRQNRCHLASSSDVPCRAPLSLLMSLDGDYCNDQRSLSLCVELEYGIKAETGRPGDSEECPCIRKPGPHISARVLGNWSGSVEKRSLSSLALKTLRVPAVMSCRTCLYPTQQGRAVPRCGASMYHAARNLTGRLCPGPRCKQRF